MVMAIAMLWQVAVQVIPDHSVIIYNRPGRL